MIEGQHPVLQALLGSLFTWGLTAVVRAAFHIRNPIGDTRDPD